MDAELTLAVLEEDDELWAAVSPDTPWTDAGLTPTLRNIAATKTTSFGPLSCRTDAELTLTPGNLTAPVEDDEFWSAVSPDTPPADACKARWLLPFVKKLRATQT